MNHKRPIIVGFDAAERTLTVKFDEPIFDRGFTLGREYQDPEVAYLKNAIELGQENCDEEYNRLRAECDAAHANAKRLLAALKETHKQARGMWNELVAEGYADATTKPRCLDMALAVIAEAQST